ncbi:MAG: HlyD family type I secretion periplasmic adaptor subunit [Alphaproteobacteria bacterium]
MIEFAPAGDNPVLAELIEGQNDLFHARQDSLEREAALLGERKSQIEQQIAGAEAQRDALIVQQALIAEELVDEQGLLAKGLSQATTARALQREAARMEGLMGGLIANIAESRGRIAEIDIEILRLQTSLREDAIATLRDLQFREIELRERKVSMNETALRMDIQAPTSGVIYGKQFFTIRSVVRPAEAIMYIVPQDSPLVIATRIPAIHIDQVHIGQEANLRFSAFDMRTTPEIKGTVTKISPDVFVDEATGATFYTAEILPYPEELAKLDGLEVLPGMPVEAFLKTDERTPWQYLIKPLADYFNKAFRES